jgi:hypothetical protein
LKRRHAALAENALRGAENIVNRKKLRRGKAAGEGDDLRLFCNFENLAYGRRAQTAHSARKLDIHACFLFSSKINSSISVPMNLYKYFE